MAGVDVKVDFRNLRLASKTLKQFDPDLRKEMFAAVGSALKPIVTDAKGFVQDEPPFSGWAEPRKPTSTARFPIYNADVMRKGFRQIRTMNKRLGNGWIAQAGIRNATPAGIIYETTGTGKRPRPNKSNNPYAKQQFRAAVDAQSQLPRTHYKLGVRAVVKNYKNTRRLIQQAINDAESKFYARMGEARR